MYLNSFSLTYAFLQSNKWLEEFSNSIKKAKQNVTTSIKSKSQVIKDIKLKEIMAFAGVSLIESTSIPTESHAATPMQSDLINI
jgi:hypothetical protein